MRMYNFFKIYNVDFGACSVIRSLPRRFFYNVPTDYLIGSEALVIDGGTLESKKEVNSSYSDKVANDLFLYGKINFLISHFHKDHCNLILDIIEKIKKKRMGFSFNFFPWHYRHDKPTIYIYSPFNYEDEIYFSILSLIFRICNKEKISDDEYYVLLQFTLTLDIRKLFLNDDIKVRLLSGESEFEVNNQIFKVLKKKPSINQALRNTINNFEFSQFFSFFKKKLKDSELNLRYLSIICRAYDRNFVEVSTTTDFNSNGFQEKYRNFMEYLSEFNALFREREEIDILKEEINFAAIFFEKYMSPSFKKILSKTNFDQHRYNLSFYSADTTFIYFGDNTKRDTMYGLKCLLVNNSLINFNVACANHHGTSTYASSLLRLKSQITYGKMYCSNGYSNSNYKPVDYNSYKEISNSLYLTNLRLRNKKDNGCPIVITNDLSFGTPIEKTMD